ncbi:MAG TPA: serine hydrolase domain-containing protein, partial [Minicystis sp.]|nr:serine hydrolase domain-containing protein [Minicystis sp.]
GGASSSTRAPSVSFGAGGQGGCAALASAMREAADQIRAAADAPGAALAADTPDCGLVAVSSGEGQPGEPLRPGLLLRIGSITKSYVSAALLEEAAAGALSLDDALEAWVPGFPNGAAITVRELLNHTSGVFNYTDDATFDAALASDPGKHYAPEDLVAIAAQHPPYFAPGQGFRYSNTDYVLAGLVLEAASGQPLASELRTRLLGPAMLSHTFLAGDEPVGGELAHAFVDGEDVTSLFDPSIAWAAGAMVATASDAAAWGRALWSGAVLDAASQAELLETVPTGLAGESYGLGVIVLDATSFAGARAIGHNGAFPGYLSWALYFPDVDASFACTVTTTPSDLSAIDPIVPTMAGILGASAP